MKIILDCNIWISFLIGHRVNLVRQILTDVRFDVYVCSQLMDEIKNVAQREKIRKYVSENDVEELCRIIFAFCKPVAIDGYANVFVRDPKDLYLLSLAESIDADYIVSGDYDILDIKSYNKTSMITLSEFREMMQY